MRNLLPNQIKYNRAFADTIYKEYRRIRFGISSCKESDKDLVVMRKHIVDWQQHDDAGALNETSIQYQTWLGVTYDDVLYRNGGIGYINTSPVAPTIGMNYMNADNGSGQNIIQISAGGCITRINLNPSIVIAQNSSYVHTQTTPATIWVIQHKLQMIPNVRTEDTTGQDIEGIIENIDENNMKIYFTQAVAGKAYLS